MIDRYYIIDNFYSNPDIIREIAISQQKEDRSNGNYPGVMTKTELFPENLQNIISELTREKVEPGTPLNGEFRFALDGATSKQTVHFDYGHNMIWAGVLYLTPDEYLDKQESGTIFWKHKRTGLSSIPLSKEGIEKYGWKDEDDLKVFLDTEGNDLSLWEKTLTIQAKYNRIVLFRPWVFHSSAINGFGDSFENCRCIQTFFLKQKTI